MCMKMKCWNEKNESRVEVSNLTLLLVHIINLSCREPSKRENSTSLTILFYIGTNNPSFTSCRYDMIKY